MKACGGKRSLSRELKKSICADVHAMQQYERDEARGNCRDVGPAVEQQRNTRRCTKGAPARSKKQQSSEEEPVLKQEAPVKRTSCRRGAEVMVGGTRMHSLPEITSKGAEHHSDAVWHAGGAFRRCANQGRTGSRFIEPATANTQSKRHRCSNMLALRHEAAMEHSVGGSDEA